MSSEQIVEERTAGGVKVAVLLATFWRWLLVAA